MIRLVRALVPVGALRPLLIECVLVAGSLLLATYLLAYPSSEVFLAAGNGVARLAFVLATLMASMRMRGLYSPSIRRRPRLFLAQELCLALGFTFIVQGVLAFLNVELRTPIRITLAGGILAIAAILAWRSAYGTVVWKAAERPVLFVGNSPVLDELAAWLQLHPDAGLRLTGYVGEPRPESGEPAVKNLGRLKSLDEIVRATSPDLIVIGQEQWPPGAVMTLFELRTAGLQMVEDSAFLEQLCEYFPLTQLGPSRLIFSGGLRARQSRLWNAVDVVLAAAALLAALPPMLAAGLAVKLFSGGPVLESEPYTGKNGEVFPLYRFRLADGEDRTPAGGLMRLLRRLKIEQWPRLFNVLRGEMSFVGPRPERAEFARILSRRIPFYAQRHAVRPGLTGWAQIRYEETPEDSLRRLQYDLYYIKHRSLLLNNYILLRTLADLFRITCRPTPLPDRSTPE